MSKERSPFSPGKPVPPQFFVGREEQVKLLRRAVQQASVGSPQYVFITGERGIGKSSLACLARDLAVSESGFIGAHALLGGSESLGEVCRRLYQALVSQLIPEKSLVDKVRDLFRQYIDRVDLFGVGVEFKRDDRARSGLAENFLPLLAETWKTIGELDRKGIFLIADDLNGISQDAKFGHFLKSAVDQIAVSPMRDFPWVLTLVGVPERMDDLRAQQPSVDRIFQVIELAPASRDEAREFYGRAFQSVNHRLDPWALDAMAFAGGGVPVIWHEIGDAVFWADNDEFVDPEDVRVGVRRAVQNLGTKYLKRPLYDELTSDVYRRILEYVAQLPGFEIRRCDALAALPQREAKNFDNFVRKMRELGVLKLVPGRRGEYQFANLLFSVYVGLQSQARKQAEERPNGRNR